MYRISLGKIVGVRIGFGLLEMEKKWIFVVLHVADRSLWLGDRGLSFAVSGFC